MQQRGGELGGWAGDLREDQPPSGGPQGGPPAAGQACWTRETRISVQACHPKTLV